jgi:hypothetical protein
MENECLRLGLFRPGGAVGALAISRTSVSRHRRGDSGGRDALRYASPVARRRLVDLSTTPARLRLLLIALVLLSLAWGAFAAFAASEYSATASGVASVRGPLSLTAEQIYARLSDADDAATTAFLAGGLEPAAVRQRYLADIRAAATGIESATAQSGSGTGPTSADLRTLAAELPVYTGEIETARADNRLALPLGAAYLREASALMRGTLLPAAQDMYTTENASLTASSDRAASVPLIGVTIAVGIAIGCVLCWASLWLARRTNRALNAGLVAAGLVGVASLGWLAAGYAAGHDDLRTAQGQGSAPVAALARVDIAALQAHADESLTLIDDSGDDSYQQDYLREQKALGPGPGTLLTAAWTAAQGSPAAPAVTRVVADAQAWYRHHVTVRTLDDTGTSGHAAAVQSVLSADASGSGGQFGVLTTDLAAATAKDQAAFDVRARAAASAFAPLEGEVIVTALIMAAGCAWGLSRRLAEYR